MGLFILRFWPVLIPLVVYVLWIMRVRRRAAANGEPVPRFRDGPWYWAVLASLGVALLCFLWIGASQEAGRGSYVPPHMENGVLMPGKIIP